MRFCFKRARHYGGSWGWEAINKSNPYTGQYKQIIRERI